MKKKLKTYIVRYSSHATAKVKAFTAAGARQQAWKMLGGGHKYGWSRREFMKKAKVLEKV